MDANDVMAALLSERPSFHQLDHDVPQNFAIDSTVLRWLCDNVANGSTTLETGAGYTTVVLCAGGGQHTAVAPAETEFAAIRAFCKQHGVPTDTFVSHVDISQRVLPAEVEGPRLDLVLIDGDHAFPAPFIDWYYTADRLRKDGWLLVDDTQLQTGHVLREFLRAEPEWDLVTDLGKTAVFRRLTDEPVTDKWWGQQPWSAQERLTQAEALRRKVVTSLPPGMRTQLRKLRSAR